MRKLCFAIFILVLVSPVFADSFSLSEKYTGQKSCDKEIVFGLLQYTAWVLIDMDMVFTYNSIWNHRMRERNPFWRAILDKPPLVFAATMVIKVGIIWGSSKLYKKNKTLAYAFIILVNVVQIYFVNSHLRGWRKW